MSILGERSCPVFTGYNIAMKKRSVTELLTNRIENPLGFQLGEAPRLSWLVDAANGDDIRTRVEVAADDEFSGLLHDSGFCENIDSIGYTLPRGLLQPRTRYYWRVSISCSGETVVSGPAWFETAKMREAWSAEWITPVSELEHPVIFADIPVDKNRVLRSARAYICGLGLCEVFIGGVRAGDECLAPGLCAYDKWLPYQTYDIGALLNSGTNRVEIALGNGWYKGRYGLDRQHAFHYGEEFACICELRLAYEDGEETFSTSTDGWSARLSAVTASNVFDGEARDDTRDTSQSCGVKRAAVETALLEPRRSPPIRVMQRLKPVEVIHTPTGETVLDMGQNMVGWLEFTNRAPWGERVFLQFGEVLQDGSFYRDNLRTSKAEFSYVSDGTEKQVRQQFTFYGFRYVKLTEWKQPVNPEDFTGLVLYSDMRETGRITTGNAKVNRLFENTLWGQRGNFWMCLQIAPSVTSAWAGPVTPRYSSAQPLIIWMFRLSLTNISTI